MRNWSVVGDFSTGSVYVANVYPIEVLLNNSIDTRALTQTPIRWDEQLPTDQEQHLGLLCWLTVLGAYS